jgi:hypothetical protein
MDFFAAMFILLAVTGWLGYITSAGNYAVSRVVQQENASWKHNPKISQIAQGE